MPSYSAGALLDLQAAGSCEEHRQRLQGTILNLEKQLISLESAATNTAVMKGYEIANRALSDVHKDV